MADFLLTSDTNLDGTGLQQKLITTHRARSHSGRCGPFTYAVARVDDPDMWFPAESQDSNRVVLLSGRIALSAAEWDAAERLPQQGGLAARHLLNQWRAAGSASVPTFNGAGVAIFLDPKADLGYLRTDRIGWAPVFASCNGRPLVIGSHPDSIAAVLASLGMPSLLDEVTMAEFVRTGTATQPHTYYRDIVQLEPAALYQFSLSPSTETLKLIETYWSPATLKGGAPASRSEFIEELVHGMRIAGRLRSSGRMGKPAVLLSAGADSRGILCSLTSPQEAQTYTYFDEPNPELDRARAIATATGTPHTALKRAEDYYITNAEETVRLSGGMWSIDSGHHTGFVEDIWSTPNLGTLLTGCYADYLFKGVGLNTVPKRLFGRNLPLKNLAKPREEFYLGFSQISEKYLDNVMERGQRRFGDSIAQQDHYELQWRRLSPISREGDACGRLALWRQLPIDPILADNSILDAYSIQGIDDKLSGIAFGMAIAQITGPAVASVPNNNFSAPVGTGEIGRVVAFLGASLRRKAEMALTPNSAFRPRGVSTYGSWPNFQIALGQSEIARAWFDDLCGVGHYDLIDGHRAEWSYNTFIEHDVVQLLRLLTIHLWRNRFAVVPP